MDWKNKLGMIQNKVKGQLHARKIDDLESVGRLIQEFDLDNSGHLDENEFVKFLSKAGIFLTTQELRSIYDIYDTNRDGNINYAEFIQFIRNEMSEKRLAVVKHAFQFLDRNNQKYLALSELVSLYQAKDHPRVRTREKTSDQVRAEFHNAIYKKSSDKKNIKENEFLDYYADINATLPHEKEDYFVDLVLKTWGITTSFNYVSAERLAELEVILYEKIRQKTTGLSDEGKTAKKAFKYFDIDNRGVINLKQFAQALEQFGCVFTKYEIEALFRKYDTDSSGKLAYDEFCNIFAYMGAGNNPNINPVFALARQSPQDVLKNNREDLRKRGVHGVQDLAVALRKADKNKTGKIDRNGFTWAAKEAGLVMSKHDLDKLFHYLDKNWENSIDYNAYLMLIRSPLSNRRLEAVLKAYRSIDQSNTGSVPLLKLADLFNPYATAKVKKGQESPEFAKQYFIGEFQGLKSVTERDFVDYFTNLGAHVEDDDIFINYVFEAFNVSDIVYTQEPVQIQQVQPVGYPKPILYSSPERNMNGTQKMRVTWKE